jgi:hypothetical protein
MPGASGHSKSDILVLHITRCAANLQDSHGQHSTCRKAAWKSCKYTRSKASKQVCAQPAGQQVSAQHAHAVRTISAGKKPKDIGRKGAGKLQESIMKALPEQYAGKGCRKACAASTSTLQIDHCLAVQLLCQDAVCWSGLCMYVPPFSAASHRTCSALTCYQSIPGCPFHTRATYRKKEDICNSGTAPNMGKDPPLPHVAHLLCKC